MMTMAQPMENSSSTIKSYVSSFRPPKSVDDIMQMVYGNRRDRRRLERKTSDFKLVKHLEAFKAFTEGFLEASINYLEIIEHLAYPELENTEKLAPQAVSIVAFRASALNKLKEKHNIDIIDVILDKSKKLIDKNKKIQEQASYYLSCHSPVKALERGFILISDLNDDTLEMDMNFKIDLSEVDDEIRGEVVELGITVYEDSVKAVTSAVREYIKEIYEELQNTKNSNLSLEMELQKNILSSSLIKKD